MRSSGWSCMRSRTTCGTEKTDGGSVLRSYRTAPRYVQRYYNNDEGYVVRRGYGNYGGPGYYDRGYGYGYGYGGPGVGFSFGARGW